MFPDDSLPPIFPEDPTEESGEEDAEDAPEGADEPDIELTGTAEEESEPEVPDPAEEPAFKEEHDSESRSEELTPEGGGETDYPDWMEDDGEEEELEVEGALPIAKLSAKQITFAAVFTEMVLLLIAFVAIYFTGIEWWKSVDFSGTAWLHGLGWAVGFLILNAGMTWLALRWDAMQALRDLLVRVWYPLAKKLSVWQIFLISLFAGVCAEFFFRGAVQEITAMHWGETAGVVIAGAVFGALHAPPTERENLPLFLYYGTFGAIISVIYVVSNHNLGVVIVLHFLYDLIALLSMKYLDFELESPETEDQS